MSVEKERVLSTEVIANFPRALGLDNKAQFEFQSIAQGWLEAVKEHEDALSLRAQRIALAEEEVSHADREAIHAREEFDQARRLVSRSNDISIVKGRIREKLHRLKVWPFWLRITRPLVVKFLGGEPVKVHPYIEAFSQNTLEVQAFLQDAKSSFGTSKERIDKEEHPKIAEVERKVQVVENKLFGWIGRQVSGSREKTLEIMHLVPQRRELFADIYAKQNASSTQELEYFLSFVQNTPAFKWDTLIPQHKIYWYGRKREWVTEQRSPTSEEYNELPNEVKRLWVSDLHRRVLAGF